MIVSQREKMFIGARGETEVVQLILLNSNRGLNDGMMIAGRQLVG